MMKKYFLLPLLIALIPNMVFGASARYSKLLHEKQRKMEQLEKCMGASKGLKVAGVSTLGLTAVGVAGNVWEAQAIKDNESTIKRKEKELNNLDAKLQKKKDEQTAKEAEQQQAEYKKQEDVQRKIDEAEDKPITDEEFAAIELEYKKNHCASDEHWDDTDKNCVKNSKEDVLSEENQDNPENCTDIVKTPTNHVVRAVRLKNDTECKIIECEDGFKPSNGIECISDAPVKDEHEPEGVTFVSAAAQLVNKGNTGEPVSEGMAIQPQIPVEFSRDITYIQPNGTEIKKPVLRIKPVEMDGFIKDPEA